MRETINYGHLIVNPENYRFDPVENQDEAIGLMLEEKGQEVLNLAKHILRNGLDKARSLRVLSSEKDKYIVLDGNRRLTAIKCLHDPSIIKNEKLKNSFKSLLKSEVEIPENIECFVYSTEEDAADWIKLDHTGKNDGIGQDPWGTAEKDRFGYRFEGKRSPAMQAVSIVEKETKRKLDTRKLKISTINRILSNPEARSYLGVVIDRGRLDFKSKKEEAVARLEKLFSRIINDNITVANVYHAPQTIEFVKGIFGQKPISAPEQPSLLMGRAQVSDSDVKLRTAIPGTLVKNDWITHGEYQKYEGAQKVKYLLNEMRKIDPR